MKLLITNSASDPDVPAQSLAFSLDPGAPVGASINGGSGVLSWTPMDSQVGSASMTVRVTDDGSPPASSTASFTVNVLPRPVIQVGLAQTNQINLSWSAISNRVYRLQYQTNLTSGAWFDLTPDLTATGSSLTQPETISANEWRFYRVLVVR